jgi:hypothetical protein
MLNPSKMSPARPHEGETDGRPSEQRKGGNAELIPAPVLNWIELILDRIRDWPWNRSPGRLEGHLRTHDQVVRQDPEGNIRHVQRPWRNKHQSAVGGVQGSEVQNHSTRGGDRHETVPTRSRRLHVHAPLVLVFCPMNKLK